MDEASPRLYMDAVIRPNRSLSSRGMWLVLGAFAFFNLWIATFLFVIGAYPAPVFLGADFVGVVIAFRLYGRKADRVERVRVDADRIIVSRQTIVGNTTVWTSPTAFTRVRFEGDSDDGRRLSLHLSARSIAIGETLGSAELERLAVRLQAAMGDALAERCS